jgi:UDP-4-amino-4,6-dideoxy-N-acetyl-beta-L-altrosamine N-acetyltransferase
MILDWRNDPSTRNGMFNSSLIGLSDHESWFKAYCRNDDLFWYIYSNLNGCGGVVYFEKSLVDNTATWGFYSRPGSQKGTGFLLCSEALQTAFTRLNLDVVFGEVLHDNLASVRLHKRLGFEESKRCTLDATGNDDGQLKFQLSKAKWIKFGGCNV